MPRVLQRSEIGEKPSFPGYETEAILGTGGFGTVYRVRQLRTGRLFAAKLLSLYPDQTQDERQKSLVRFEREVSLCRELHHPHIVGLHDRGILNDVPYAVFDLVPGVTLAALLLSDGPMSPSKAKGLMAQVLDALMCAHGQGVIHRDLKPSNIMVTSHSASPAATVVDFGIGAFLPGYRGITELTLTASSEFLGSPRYASPEQLRQEPISEATDLFSWALVFVECLCARPVVQGANAAEIFHNILSSDEFQLPAALARHPLGRLLRTCLRKNANQRPADLAALHCELSQMHVEDLVGVIEAPLATSLPDGEATAQSPASMIRLRRQVTSLSCSFMIKLALQSDADEVVVYEALRDQIERLRELAAGWGGKVAGALGSRILVHFGITASSEVDSRFAIGLAIDLLRDLRNRQSYLENQGISVALRMGLDSELVSLASDGSVVGMVDAIASRLEEAAEPSTLRLSARAMSLLRRHAQFHETTSLVLPGRNQPEATYVLADDTSPQSGAVRAGIIGRGGELARTEAALHDGTAPFVLLQGTAGVGKSRLASELVRRLFSKGWRTLEFRFAPEHKSSALFHLLEHVREQLGISPGSEASLSELERGLTALGLELPLCVPIVGLWLRVPLGEKYANLQHSPAKQTAILFDVVARCLDISREQPLLLVFEDLHWADPSTLKFIGSLRRAGGRYSILGTSRSEFQTPPMLGDACAVAVEPLGREHCMELVRSLLQPHAISERIAGRIVEGTDQVPLFVEEFTRMLLESGRLLLRYGEYQWQEEPGAHRIPANLRELLLTRLDAAGVHANVAQVAAAIGSSFDYEVLRAVAPQPELALREQLRALTALRILRSEGDKEERRYSFCHALLREAAYDSLDPDARKAAHLRIVKVADKQFPLWKVERPAEFADQLAGAGHFAEAASCVLLATQSSIERGSVEVAASLAKRGLDWIRNLSPKERLPLELPLNTVLMQSLPMLEGWAGPTVRETVQRTQALLTAGHNAEASLPTLWTLASYHHTASQRPAQARVVLELTELAKHQGNLSLLTLSTAFRGLGLWCEGEYGAARKSVEDALSAYQSEQDLPFGKAMGCDARMLALATRCLLRAFTDLPEGGRDDARACVAWARECQHVPSLGLALMYAAAFHVLIEDREGAAPFIEDLIALSHEYGQIAFLPYGLLMNEWVEGQFSARNMILGQLEGLGCLLGLPFYESLQPLHQQERGAWEDAADGFRDCVDRSRAIGELCLETEFLRRRGLCLLRLAREEEGRLALEEAARLARLRGMPVVELRALSELYDFSKEVVPRITELRQLHPEIVERWLPGV